MAGGGAGRGAGGAERSTAQPNHRLCTQCMCSVHVQCMCSACAVPMHHLQHAAAKRLVIIDRREVGIEEGDVQRGVWRGECEASSAAVLGLPAGVLRVFEHGSLGAGSLVQEESVHVILRVEVTPLEAGRLQDLDAQLAQALTRQCRRRQASGSEAARRQPLLPCPRHTGPTRLRRVPSVDGCRLLDVTPLR